MFVLFCAQGYKFFCLLCICLKNKWFSHYKEGSFLPTLISEEVVSVLTGCSSVHDKYFCFALSSLIQNK